MNDALARILNGLAAANPSGPGLTPQSFAGSLGNDDVTSGVSTPAVPSFTAAPDLVSHYHSLLGGITPPTPNAAPVDPSIANAGVAQVDPMSMPSVPAPVHQSLLARIAGGISRGVDKFGNALSPIPDGLGIDSAAAHRARSAAFLALGSALANPQYDAHGFRQSFIGSLTSGLQGAHQASEQSIAGTIAANQLAAQRAQSTDLLTKRAALRAQFSISPTDSPAEVDAKVQGLAAGYAGIGDYQSLNALGQASALFKQPKPPAAPRALEHVETIDPKTGKPIVGWFDSATGQMVNSTAAVPKPDPAVRAMSMEQQDKSIDRVTKTYDNETKDFQKARGGYEVLQGALTSPNLYSPFALLDSFARVVNPGAVVRPTTLELLKATGSAPDRVRRWAALVDSGQWPADLTAALKNTMDGIMSQHFITAQAARKRALTRLNTMGVANADTYLDDLNYNPNANAAPSAKTPAAPAPTTGTTANPY